MNTSRRYILKSAGSAGVIGAAMMAGLLRPTMAFAAWNKPGFEAKDINNALAAIGAGGAAVNGNIGIKAPDIAENGAVVPVEVVSNIPGTERIAILADKNGTPLIGEFTIMNGAEAFVSTRIKMGTTSNVVAVVSAGGKTYIARKEVKVTIGGCGG